MTAVWLALPHCIFNCNNLNALSSADQQARVFNMSCSVLVVRGIGAGSCHLCQLISQRALAMHRELQPYFKAFRLHHAVVCLEPRRMETLTWRSSQLHQTFPPTISFIVVMLQNTRVKQELSTLSRSGRHISISAQLTKLSSSSRVVF